MHYSVKKGRKCGNKSDGWVQKAWQLFYSLCKAIRQIDGGPVGGENCERDGKKRTEDKYE